MYDMHLLPATNSGEPRLQAARKTDRGTIFILRPHATACNLTLEGGTNIGVIIPLCDDSDPCAENELNDSKLEKLTHRGAMTPACAMNPACAITRTITVHCWLYCRVGVRGGRGGGGRLAAARWHY